MQNSFSDSIVADPQTLFRAKSDNFIHVLTLEQFLQPYVVPVYSTVQIYVGINRSAKMKAQCFEQW